MEVSMAAVGDRVHVASRKLGHPPREGVVTGLSGRLVRVTWSTGEESTIIPGTGSVSIGGKPKFSLGGSRTAKKTTTAKKATTSRAQSAAKSTKAASATKAAAKTTKAAKTAKQPAKATRAATPVKKAPAKKAPAKKAPAKKAVAAKKAPARRAGSSR
jgi:Domain of unknown function (DUF1918)